MVLEIPCKQHRIKEMPRVSYLAKNWKELEDLIEGILSHIRIFLCEKVDAMMLLLFIVCAEGTWRGWQICSRGAFFVSQTDFNVYKKETKILVERTNTYTVFFFFFFGGGWEEGWAKRIHRERAKHKIGIIVFQYNPIYFHPTNPILNTRWFL